jgi:phosphatidylglycerophosphate synthase
VLLIFVGLGGFALCITPLLWLNIVGALLLLLQEVLDCVDGEIARWTKKSSLKGLYLDRVGHVICDAPVSCMCALHIYVVNHQPLYLVLAFLAYAMSQIRMGLKEEYFRIFLQIPQDKIVSDAVQNNGPANKIKSAIRLLSLISVDVIFIKIVSIITILLFDEGIEFIAAILCWFIIITTALENMATTINRYLKYIPDIEHTKRFF